MLASEKRLFNSSAEGTTHLGGEYASILPCWSKTTDRSNPIVCSSSHFSVSALYFKMECTWGPLFHFLLVRFDFVNSVCSSSLSGS
jgi:hypothetical protein